MEKPIKKKKKTVTGHAFANLRWHGPDPGDKRADGINRVAAAMARKRWEGISAEERSRMMSEAGFAQTGGPRDPNQPRCPCGAMTLKRAEARAGKTGTSKGHRRGCRFYKREQKAA